jgi:hypothetical protein
MPPWLKHGFRIRNVPLFRSPRAPVNQIRRANEKKRQSFFGDAIYGPSKGTIGFRDDSFLHR